MIKSILFLLSCLLLCDQAAAVGKKRSSPAAASAVRQSPANPAAVRSNAPVLVATTAAPGQAGYVHYFVIKNPDESLETQIGIELDDQRIAWSFPDLGVVVSPFIESGPMPANGKTYEIEHLYGIRPFPDDESMRVLRKELVRRIVSWIDDETPHCYLRGPRDPFCMSCMDFVAQVLFPGRSPGSPALPRDFERAGSSARYTTDDLLLYLVGLHGLPSREARFKRIGELALPESFLEEVIRIVNSIEPNDVTGAARASAPPTASAKDRPAARPSAKVVKRPQERRRL